MKIGFALLAGMLLSAIGGLGPPSPFQQPRTTIAGETVQLDAGRRETVQRFSLCCKVIPFGENLIVQNKNLAAGRELGGMVYFENGKVSGLASDRSWSAEKAPYDTALAFYRLVEERSHGDLTKTTVYAHSREATNASSKYVMLQFADGRRIRLEITHLDSGADISQQVVVSECVGSCVDW